MTNLNKIPFEKKTAELFMNFMDLMIQMSEEFNYKLTTKQLKGIKGHMKKKYYNSKVELLE